MSYILCHSIAIISLHQGRSSVLSFLFYLTGLYSGADGDPILERYNFRCLSLDGQVAAQLMKKAQVIKLDDGSVVVCGRSQAAHSKSSVR
jgi:hypothetical protein